MADFVKVYNVKNKIADLMKTPINNKEFFKNKKSRFWQLIEYIFLSGIAFLVELSILYILTSIIGFYYIISVIIAYCIGGTLQFILIKYINFKNKSKKIIKQFILYVIVILGGLLLTIIIMYCLVDFLGIWYLFARILTLFIVLFYSFNMHRIITFKN